MVVPKKLKQPKRRSYKSGLEETVAKQLEKVGITGVYEIQKISYSIPQTEHTYSPDFTLPNGIIVETKGLFILEDRKKHLLLQEQYPKMDLRFVFSNSRAKIYKGAKSTYGDWCDKHGFQYADKAIPSGWLCEQSKR